MHDDLVTSDKRHRERAEQSLKEAERCYRLGFDLFMASLFGWAAVIVYLVTHQPGACP